MNISIKLKASIQSRLDKVKNETFAEDDIKLLLIDIRESIRAESLLREFADFIAHPTRHKGIFNKTLNTRYIKLKLIDEQHKKLDTELRNKFQTERQLSDFLLSGVDINKVEKNLFEILFINGLADISEKVFRDHYPLTKKQVQKLLKDSYQLDNKKHFYELKNKKSSALIEDALKFIRGTIQANAVFNQQNFEKEFIKATTRFINILNLDKSYSKAIQKNLRPILLCILCLLHDSKFVFHDNHIGTCFLSIYPDDNKSLYNKPDKNSLIAIISDDIGVQMPLFISNIKISEHLNLDGFTLDKLKYMERIPWINAQRNERNKLILTT